MHVVPSRQFRLSPIAALVGSLFATSAAHAAEAAPASGAAASSPADAGTATSVNPEVVMVTARRRQETLFDVPAAVTAISGDGLRLKGITSAQDIVALVPNAVIPDDPQGFNTYINIRGIRQADAQAEPNFGLYRNGIYNGGHRTNLGALIDLQRVELLRGPQGGLYGRNAVGGAMDIVYKMPQPGEASNGYGTLSFERYERTRFEGAVSLPVNPNISVRVTGWTIEQRKGEYFNQTLDEQIDRQRDQGLRVSAVANLGSALTGTWTAEYQKTRGPSQRTYAPDGVANGPVVVSPPETPDTIQRDTPSLTETEQFYAAQTLSYATDAGTLTLLASYRDYRLTGIEDQDFTALPITAGPVVLQQLGVRDEQVKNYYAEALWSSPDDRPFTWRAGASFFHEDFDFSRAYVTSLDLAQIGVGSGTLQGAAGIPHPGSAIGTRSTSVFGDLRYAFSPQLAATASLRWTRDKESLAYSQGIQPSGDPVNDAIAQAIFGSSVPSYELNTTRNFSFTAPAVGVEYKANSNVNVYALYSTGYRPGGFNTTSTSPEFIPYDQESARNLEAGVKTRWLDGRVGVNLSVFRMDQKNLVISQNDPNNTQFAFTYLANVSKARTWGAELESVARVNAWLDAAFSVGWLDSKFTQGTANEGTPYAVDMTGRPIPYSRPWTLNARLDVSHPLSDSTQFFGSLGIRREIGGKIGNLSQQDYENLTKLDLTAGLRLGKQWQLSSFVHNATDQRVVQFRFDNGAVATNRGRSFGLQATRTF